MKQLAAGFLLGVLIMTASSMIVSATPAQEEDSIKTYMDRLEKLIREKIAENIATGRFQLQSFSIDRTHWHYMLDTATGKLYRMELGRKPEISNWVLISKGIVNPYELPPIEEPTE